jgi:hypothetical protein
MSLFNVFFNITKIVHNGGVMFFLKFVLSVSANFFDRLCLCVCVCVCVCVQLILIVPAFFLSYVFHFC